MEPRVCSLSFEDSSIARSERWTWMTGHNPTAAKQEQIKTGMAILQITCP